VFVAVRVEVSARVAVRLGVSARVGVAVIVGVGVLVLNTASSSANEYGPKSVIWSPFTVRRYVPVCGRTSC
jgi:hypothetical protein